MEPLPRALPAQQPHPRAGSSAWVVLLGSHLSLHTRLRGACLCRAHPLPWLLCSCVCRHGNSGLCLPLFTHQGDEKRAIGTQ